MRESRCNKKYLINERENFEISVRWGSIFLFRLRNQNQNKNKIKRLILEKSDKFKALDFRRKFIGCICQCDVEKKDAQVENLVESGGRLSLSTGFSDLKISFLELLLRNVHREISFIAKSYWFCFSLMYVCYTYCMI